MHDDNFICTITKIFELKLICLDFVIISAGKESGFIIRFYVLQSSRNVCFARLPLHTVYP